VIAAGFLEPMAGKKNAGWQAVSARVAMAIILFRRQQGAYY